MDELLIKWKEVIALVKTQINPVIFSTFMERLSPVELKGNELIIHNPEIFAQGALEKNYESVFADCLFKVYGFPVAPVFLLTEEVEKYKINAPKVPVPENELNFGLIPSFTFDTFVVGSSNRMAHAASLAVAEMPGEAYNPLYLYGHSGLGKTHLMHAIGNYALGRNPFCKILYVTSEEFTIELIESIRNGEGKNFREKYRNIDILMIDDIQFISGKKQTEEEFFNTFNTLYLAGKQVVIAGDRPPHELTTLEERLRTRLIEGLMCDLQPPDFETRMAILKKKCSQERLELSPFILEYIADNVVNNIRELKGALSIVKAYSSYNDVNNMSSAQLEVLLKDIIAPTIKNYTIEEITLKVSDYYDVPVDDILSSKHHKEINLARQVSMFVSRQLTSKSLKEIGKYFSRDYTTVINALNRIESNMLNDATLKHSVETVIHSIKEG